DRGQLLAPERGISRSFIPGDVGNGEVSLAVGEILIGPVARTRQAGTIFKLLQRVFPGNRLAVLNKRVLPVLLLEIAAASDELLILLIAHFILIDEVVVERRLRFSRSSPPIQPIRSSRNKHHAVRRLVNWQEFLLDVYRSRQNNKVTGVQNGSRD